MTQRRKRSRKAALLLVPAGTLLLTACAPHVERAAVYSSAVECSQMNPQSTQECQADYQEAVAMHREVAPKYLTQQECEADFGTQGCEPAREQHASGSFFMPLMMGYMTGRMLSGSMAGQTAAGNPIPPLQDSNAARSSVATQPLYKSRDDQRTFRTAGNYPVATGTGLTQVRSTEVRPRAAGLTRSGGFGSTAARMAISGGG